MSHSISWHSRSTRDLNSSSHHLISQLTLSITTSHGSNNNNINHHHYDHHHHHHHHHYHHHHHHHHAVTTLATTTVVSSGIPPPHMISFSFARIANGESRCLSSDSSLALRTNLTASVCRLSVFGLWWLCSHALTSCTISSRSKLSYNPSVAMMIRSPIIIGIDAVSASVGDSKDRGVSGRSLNPSWKGRLKDRNCCWDR